MSEHTKGRIRASNRNHLKTEDDVVMAVATSFSEAGANARRLAACWNSFENVRTDLVELTVGSGAMQAAADAMEKLPAVQAKLTAARALLREVIRDVEEQFPYQDHVSEELQIRICNYLDACNTLEGSPNAS